MRERRERKELSKRWHFAPTQDTNGRMGAATWESHLTFFSVFILTKKKLITLVDKSWVNLGEVNRNKQTKQILKKKTTTAVPRVLEFRWNWQEVKWSITRQQRPYWEGRRVLVILVVASSRASSVGANNRLPVGSSALWSYHYQTSHCCYYKKK